MPDVAKRQEAVIHELVSTLSAFAQVEKVILFGSRATGAAGVFSDIDLAVTGVSDDRTWTDIRQVADEARTLLKIDLLRFEKADDAIRQSILDEGKVLYERAAGQASPR